MRSGSLRNRIAVLYLVATALLTGPIFFLLYIVVDRAVYDHFDSDLEQIALQEYENLIILSDHIAFENPSQWQEAAESNGALDPIFLELTDPHGRPIKKSQNLRHGALPLDSTIRNKAYCTASLFGSPIRLAQLPVRSPQQRILGYLLIAVPCEDAEFILKSIRLILLIAYPVLLLSLFAIGRSIAGRSILPVNTIISTAEQITEKNITDRIPLPAEKDELYRLAATINSLLDRLEAAIEHEQQFTADATHELLTPLSSLRGTLDVLIRQEREPAYYAKKIAACISEVNRISNLIRQLLFIARIDNGSLKPTMASVNLSESVRRAVERVEPLLAAKELRIDVSAAADTFVSADSSMLDRILQNVLSNAIKYSPERRSIQIAIQQEDAAVSLQMTDHGIGMSKEQCAKVFERFYRVDESRSSQVLGAGLGLSIVKRLADLQRLPIAVQSTPAVGTVFTITFPVHQS